MSPLLYSNSICWMLSAWKSVHNRHFFPGLYKFSRSLTIHLLCLAVKWALCSYWLCPRTLCLHWVSTFIGVRDFSLQVIFHLCKSLSVTTNFACIFPFTVFYVAATFNTSVIISMGPYLRCSPSNYCKIQSVRKTLFMDKVSFLQVS